MFYMGFGFFLFKKEKTLKLDKFRTNRKTSLTFCYIIYRKVRYNVYQIQQK